MGSIVAPLRCSITFFLVGMQQYELRFDDVYFTLEGMHYAKFA